jgi:hypothetical protein
VGIVGVVMELGLVAELGVVVVAELGVVMELGVEGTFIKLVHGPLFIKTLNSHFVLSTFCLFAAGGIFSFLLSFLGSPFVSRMISTSSCVSASFRTVGSSTYSNEKTDA